jgi:hypothetical protein
MATGDSLAGDQVTIYVESTDAISASLTNTYQAEVTSFDVSGGARDTDAIAVFGGGFVDRQKPQEQIEVSMDVILRHGTDVDQWDALWYSATGGGSLTFTGKKTIVIQASDGSNYYWNAWNNATVTNVDKEFSAEEEWKGTIAFKLSAAEATGTTNIQYGKTDVTSGTNLIW